MTLLERIAALEERLQELERRPPQRRGAEAPQSPVVRWGKVVRAYSRAADWNTVLVRETLRDGAPLDTTGTGGNDFRLELCRLQDVEAASSYLARRLLAGIVIPYLDLDLPYPSYLVAANDFPQVRGEAIGLTFSYQVPDLVTVTYADADGVYTVRVRAILATEEYANGTNRQQRWELDMSLRFRTAELAQIDLILPSVVSGDGQVRWTRSYGSGSLPEAADAATAAAYLPGKDFAHVHVASLDLGPGGAWAWNNPGLSELWQTRGADLVQDRLGQPRGGLRFAENLNGGVVQLLDFRSELGPNDFGRGKLQAAESDTIPAGSDTEVYAVYEASIPRWKLVLDHSGYDQYQVVGRIVTDHQNRLISLTDYTQTPILPALGRNGSVSVLTGVNFDAKTVTSTTLAATAGRMQ